MKAFSVGVGVGVVLALSGCSSASNETGADATGGAAGFVNPGGAAGFMNPGGAAGAAGFVNMPGQGGYVPGAGGYVPGAGGQVIAGQGGYTPGAGGYVPGAGGVINPSAGGTDPGAGGTGAGGADPSAGGAQGNGGGGPVTLASCDMRKETSAAPITQACGDVITPIGNPLKLGPLGAKMDSNVGKGFENPDPNDMATCPVFVASFAENATLSAQLLDVGTQPCNATAPNTGSCLDFKLYSTYYPATWPATPVPVITWGNGTCAQPEGYGSLLRYLASYGYFIVAANNREVANGQPLTKGLDFAAAANKDPSSPYYGHLDMTKVGVMGHSQGAGAAAIAVGDSRAQAVILWNGVSSGGSSKPFLAVSGDNDVSGTTAAAMQTLVNGSTKGAFIYYHHPYGMGTFRGHLVLMMTPERVVDAAKNFFDMLFRNDAAAHDYFVGASCGLCGHAADYDYGQKGF